MRTRRIVIRCRRTGRSAVAIGTTGTGLPGEPQVPELPGLDLPPVYGTQAYETPAYDVPTDLAAFEPPAFEAPAPHPIRFRATSDHSEATALSVPAYLADAGSVGPIHGGRTTVNPWRSNRGPDLTLADVLARPGRRDLDWNRNPGWPAGLGWAHIAGAGRGRSPRHARTRRLIRPAAVLWTGIGLLATAALMLLATALR
jgi:hypothetical protein